MKYAKYLTNRKATPQNQPIPDSPQVPNSAGGYSFPVDDWTRLDRFLILGSEGGSYYATERKLTVENTDAVLRCLQRDGLRTVRRIVGISDSGRAPKNDPAILALALASALGDAETRRAASEALPQVCRIGTHLFHYAEFVNSLRGWGRGLRRAVANWYVKAAAEDIAYQAVKYQQRDGWSHRDLLRLAHPVAPSDEHNLVFNWIVKGWPGVGEEPHPVKAGQIIWAFERARTAKKREIIRLIRDYRLPREALPTEWLTDPEVWETMLPHMGLTAMLRNLGNMSKIGLLTDRNRGVVNFVTKSITDGEQLRRARVHPIAVLAALLTYKQGHGMRGSGEWKPVTKVIDSLDAAFYAAFGNVVPCGKRIVLALDVSGSMEGGQIAGIPGLTPRIGSAAMALITAATERDCTVVAFSHQMVTCNVSPRQRLDDVADTLRRIPMGGTDCALPMRWALDNKVQADAFVVYTDSETWYGDIHPVQALQRYREAMDIPARLVVVGMVSNGFSIASPDDAGMLDVVGFDTAAPQLISNFVRGE
jgi:60 kDa SS-A/Ro ribonucleoprotein